MTTPEATAETGPQPVEISADELLAIGKRMHREHQFEPARKIYEKLVEVDPRNSEAQHYLGLLQHQTGEREAGLARVERTLQEPEATAGWWNNYCAMLRREKRYNEAIDASRRSIELDPDAYETYNNLGLVQEDKRNFAVARACFEKAIEINPGFALGWSNLGNLLVSQGEVAEGAKALMRYVSLHNANEPQGWRRLGMALGVLGEFERAQQVYKDWLAADPGNPVALHQLAAVGGLAAPSRADDRYVTMVFDSFAESFDERLAYLRYQAPELTLAEVSLALGAASGDKVVADAGCGTGLCGPGLRPFARRLVGVDLSERMIAKAQQRGVYDSLAAAELTAYFNESSDIFDVIVSADTLCYFGDLGPPAAAFRRCLAEDGLLVFTVEAHREEDGAGYKLLHNGRYVHGKAYVEEILAHHGLRIEAIRLDKLRNESGEPVMGYVVRASLKAPS